MNDRFLSMLSLCRKAGKIITGFDAVKDAISASTVFAVLLASDLSAKTAKEVRYKTAASTIKVRQIPYTMDALESVLGRRAGIVAVTDSGFADRISQMISEF